MPSGTLPDYYQMLQVDPHAEQEVIHAAYRGLAKKYHPDVYQGTDRDARMRAVNAAYAVLRDLQKRRAYDQQRRRAQEEAAAARPQGGATRQQPEPHTTTQHHAPPHQPAASDQAQGPGDWGQGPTGSAQSFAASNEPRRYSASSSPFFTSPFPPPPASIFTSSAPSSPGSAGTFQPRGVSLLGGAIVLLVFFFPWLETQQAVLFGNPVSTLWSGLDLMQSSAGWLCLVPLCALVLVIVTLLESRQRSSQQSWSLAIAFLGLITVLIFLFNASSLFLAPAMTTTLQPGSWLALGGFGLAAGELLVCWIVRSGFRRAPRKAGGA